jgi:DNA-directed RNA polymerase subunit RPC12/RpoP
MNYCCYLFVLQYDRVKNENRKCSSWESKVMSENSQSTSLKLACPHCGGKLSVMMEQTGSGYMTYDTPSGFECSTIACSVEWDIDGEPTTEPNWVVWPTLYTKPED